MAVATKKIVKKILATNGEAKLNGSSTIGNRIPVVKTYKLYIDGKFVRSESGRYMQTNNKENFGANICRASRKDIRDAVVVARKAQSDWSKKTAYNKGQILYRIGEMLEGRRAQLIHTMMLDGATETQSTNEINNAVDCFIYFAGWSDKYIQMFSSVNPVESAHFNFSYPEPTGVVTAICPDESPLFALANIIAPVIVGGNTIVVLSSQQYSRTACELAEVLHSSDVSGGVVNILNGSKKELISHLASHKDVNAMIYAGTTGDENKIIETNCAINVKRAIKLSATESNSNAGLHPYRIMSTQEIKTTWHPVGL